jgi:hypothetical protein
MFPKVSRNHILLGGFSVLAVIAIILLLYSLNLDDNAATAQAYPPPSSQHWDIEDEIKTYEEMLQRQDLSQEERLRIESLLSEDRRIATIIAAPVLSRQVVETAYAQRKTQLVQYTPKPTPTPQLGIIESGELFEVNLPRRVKVVNIWQGYVNGHLTLVYAGKLKPDYRGSAHPQETEQGALYIMTLLPDGSIETSLHITEKETGALRIQEYKNNTLILVSEGTATLATEDYYFNIQILNFVAGVDVQSQATETQGAPTSTPTQNPYP